MSSVVVHAVGRTAQTVLRLQVLRAMSTADKNIAKVASYSQTQTAF